MVANRTPRQLPAGTEGSVSSSSPAQPRSNHQDTCLCACEASGLAHLYTRGREPPQTKSLEAPKVAIHAADPEGEGCDSGQECRAQQRSYTASVAGLGHRETQKATGRQHFHTHRQHNARRGRAERDQGIGTSLSVRCIPSKALRLVWGSKYSPSRKQP